MSIRSELGGVSLYVRSRIWRDNSMQCFYCCRPAQNVADATADHVVPMTQGGMDAEWNLVPCCKSCNSSKRNVNAKTWAMPRSLLWARLRNLGWDDPSAIEHCRIVYAHVESVCAYHESLLAEVAA